MENTEHILSTLADTASVPELQIILAMNLMLLRPHSKEFIDEQRVLLTKLPIRKQILEYCNKVLDEVKIKEDK